MRNIWIALGLAVAVGGCDGGTPGNGDVTSTSRPLTGFSRVEAVPVRFRKPLAVRHGRFVDGLSVW